MSLFDLKPLHESTITELGLETHELWLVRFGDETHGPFETLSLRHYAYDNISVFNGALCTRMDVEDWVLLEGQDEFKDIFFIPDEEPSTDTETYYWILNQGQLSPRHHFQDIEKKIEMGILSLTDAVSMDEGETWNKIFHMPEFAHKLHSGGELPRCPSEASFQDAKVKVLEKLEGRSAEIVKAENMQGLAYLGQKSTQIVVLKIDEIDLDSLQETEISRSLKWAIPSVAVGMVALVMSGFFFFGENEEAYTITDSDVQVKRSISGSRSGLLGDANSKSRLPSSVRPTRSQRSRMTRSNYQESSYPTTIETHQEPDNGNDPQHEAIFDQDQPQSPQTEESLVQNQAVSADQSLDAAMNPPSDPAALDAPQVEEVSDF